jgi:hypothetical protein
VNAWQAIVTVDVTAMVLLAPSDGTPAVMRL